MPIADVPAASVTGEVLKSLVPVATLLLGYALSQYQRVRDDMQRRRNLETIVFRELADNYRIIEDVVAAESDNPFLAAHIFRLLSRSVFDAYLGKLDELAASELDATLEVYSGIARGLTASETFAKKASDPNGRDVTADAARVLVSLDRLVDDLTAAMHAFPQGDEFMNRLARDREATTSGVTA